VTAAGGKNRSRSERGRSVVAVLVKKVLRVTAVHLASCGGGYGRAPARPTKGASDATAAAFGPEKLLVVQ
jgi:hypothetical protein